MPPDEHETPHREGSTQARPPQARVAAVSAVRAVARTARLIATAIAIVLALAFGIPWLINLVW